MASLKNLQRKYGGEYMSRLLHRAYAYIRGYYWLPCPICGNMMGGHEDCCTLYSSLTAGTDCCEDCRGIVEEINRTRGYK
jgi:hypothetical protein